MILIPIPTDVATCGSCGASLVVHSIEYAEESGPQAEDGLFVSVWCTNSGCMGEGNDNGVGGWDTIAEWIIRKLAAPDGGVSSPHGQAAIDPDTGNAPSIL